MGRYKGWPICLPLSLTVSEWVCPPALLVPVLTARTEQTPAFWRSYTDAFFPGGPDPKMPNYCGWILSGWEGIMDLRKHKVVLVGLTTSLVLKLESWIHRKLELEEPYRPTSLNFLLYKWGNGEEVMHPRLPCWYGAEQRQEPGLLSPVPGSTIISQPVLHCIYFLSIVTVLNNTAFCDRLVLSPYHSLKPVIHTCVRPLQVFGSWPECQLHISAAALRLILRPGITFLVSHLPCSLDAGLIQVSGNNDGHRNVRACGGAPGSTRLIAWQ